MMLLSVSNLCALVLCYTCQTTSALLTTLPTTSIRSVSNNYRINHHPNLFMAASESALSSLSPLTVVKEDGSSSVLQASDELKERLEGKRVALYFSAGWCPMCTSFEPSLDAFRKAASDSEKPVELIYVPSDRSEEDVLQRAKSLKIPLFASLEKASDLKKKFLVWSGSETPKFGTGRRSGVPALVVLNPTDGTEMAFVDAEGKGVKALESWPLNDDSGVW